MVDGLNLFASDFIYEDFTRRGRGAMADAHENYEGVVRGGPLDGQTITNHVSKGFVLVDLARQMVWVHDYSKHFLFKDEFNAREGEPLDPEKLVKAQEDGGRSLMVLEDSDD